MSGGSPNEGVARLERDLIPLPLPEGVSSKYILVDDLVVHFLDAFPVREHIDQNGNRVEPPLLLLLHGFPELAYSWRNLLRPLADLGFRVVASDQRGFGRTVPVSLNVDSESDPYPYTYAATPLAPFRPVNLAQDVLKLVLALGYERAACVVGHDFGSVVAGLCALTRPDVFRRVVMMSSPFSGAPATSNTSFGAPNQTFLSAAEALAASGISERGVAQSPNLALDALFASMDPPRMHYQHYYSLPQANEQMHTRLTRAELHAFFRAYFHIKSACWLASHGDDLSSPLKPRPLKAWTKEEAALLPPYYLMPRGQSMPEVVRAHHPQGADLARSQAWLSEEDLAVYAREYGRTGFQGGLNRYRCITGLGRAGDTLESISSAEANHMADLALFVRKKVEVPALFVAGEKDWGPCQGPGAQAKMREVCPLMKPGNDGIVFVKNAGHWVQQEATGDVFNILKVFLSEREV